MYAARGNILRNMIFILTISLSAARHPMHRHLAVSVNPSTDVASERSRWAPAPSNCSKIRVIPSWTCSKTLRPMLSASAERSKGNNSGGSDSVGHRTGRPARGTPSDFSTARSIALLSRFVTRPNSLVNHPGLAIIQTESVRILSIQGVSFKECRTKQ